MSDISAATSTNIVSDNFKPLMYFHTSLRNVGLYTSIAFAGLAFTSRQHDKKNRAAFLLGLLLVLMFLLVSMSLNYYLYLSMLDVIKNDPDEEKTLRPFVYISMMIIPVHVIMIIFTILKLIQTGR